MGKFLVQKNIFNIKMYSTVKVVEAEKILPLSFVQATVKGWAHNSKIKQEPIFTPFKLVLIKDRIVSEWWQEGIVMVQG